MVRDKVLIVDDEKDIRGMLIQFVESKTDFEPLVARDGALGLDVLLDCNPDEIVAVVLDQDMPKMTGYHMALELWSNHHGYRDVPIIATGAAFVPKELELLERCYENFTHMKKPFKMRPFIECLKGYAERQ